MSAVPVPAARPASAAFDDGFDVLDACHRRILFALGKLSALVTRLATIGTDAEARAIAAELLGFFAFSVPQHHVDEERHVFPRLASDGDDETVQAVLRLQQDHLWLDEDWMALSPHLAAIARGQAWCELDSLRDGVLVFNALMHDHIALEESLIYPQARERLQGQQRRDMGREMAARRRAQRVPAC
ncbi:hemerythrin domain-containing protein [Aquincola sp. S2]|uniref:Hemerythrin domain-containing protein n=1 Tax=Pseudaquabacterium terrae TaxID=2732868 RepID=A0ABX2EQS1_9BURK|nr:hemerythrin domain-containing protein [Aquabacterium terrae]NRF70958.1 hemerythrin domain-containing protein [Aquabacterium terrae]